MAEPWQNQAQTASSSRDAHPSNYDAANSLRSSAAGLYVGLRSAIGGTDPPVWIENDEHDVPRLVYVAAGSLWVCSNPGESNSVVTQLDLNLSPIDFLPGTGLQLSADPKGRSVAWVTDEIYMISACGPTSELASRVGRRVTNLGCRIESYSWSSDCTRLILSANRSGHFQLWVVDTSDGSSHRLTSETTGTVDINPTFTYDDSAVVFARLDASWTCHTIMMLPLSGDSSVPIPIARDVDNFNYMKTAHFGLKASPTANLACFRSQRSGHTNLWLVRLEPGAQPFPLCPEQAEQSAAVWSADGGSIAYATNNNGTHLLSVANVTMHSHGAHGSTEQAAFVGHTQLPLQCNTVYVPREGEIQGVGMCSGVAWSRTGNAISFMLESPTQPMQIWRVNMPEGQNDRTGLYGAAARQALPYSQVTSPNGGLPTAHSRLANLDLISPVKRSYFSSDGVEIHAYVYQPVEHDDRNGGGVVMVHGGPSAQWNDAFDPIAQFLVSQGYVVIMPNIRGSTGYGRAFEELNDRDWGGGDLMDCIAAAGILKDDYGVQRVGLTGTSYGGCMAMNVVGFTRDIFDAVVAMSGYGNWPHLRDELELRHLKLLEHELGPYALNEETWHRCSPIYSIAESTTPALILHGTGKEPESRASLVFYKALRQHYKIAEYKAYPDECYYVMSEAGLQEMYVDMAEFFDRYIGIGASAIDTGNRTPRVLKVEERTRPFFERRLGRVAHL